MIDHDRTSIIATLEKVFAQLKASMDDQRENETADSAVHKSWKLVGEAIDHLRSVRGDCESIDGRTKANALDRPDDLTSIRGISTEFAEHLASLGVTRYAEIAAWRDDDLHRVAKALDLPREIGRQNWIEQAALLDRRKKQRENAIELSQSAGALTADEATGGFAVPAVASQLNLPEIREAIRDDEHTQEEPLPPLEAKPAPQLPSRPTEAEIEPLAAAIDKKQTDAAHAESVGTWPARPSSQGARVPTVTASSHVSTDAAKRVRQFEQERQNLARKLGRVGGLPDEDEEAAVSFVIREDAQPQRGPTADPATPSRRSALVGASRHASGREDAETYVANRSSAEEAEVVVLKPQVQNRYGSIVRPQGGAVKRFLKALRGGD